MNSRPPRQIVNIVSLLVTGLLFPEIGKGEESFPSLPDNTFVMSINRPDGSPLYTFVSQIYREVFLRLRVDFKAVYHPLKRASIEANNGSVDGEPARIYSYGASYPNLIRIDEPVFLMTVVAYSTDPTTHKLEAWESLRDTGHRVGYPRGMKISEKNLPGLISKNRLYEVTDTVQGLRNLADGRIDIYIDDMNSASPIIQNNKANLNKKVYAAGIMEKVPLYMYVHVKHQALVPRLADIIRQIKAEGLVDKYRRQNSLITEM